MKIEKLFIRLLFSLCFLIFILISSSWCKPYKVKKGDTLWGIAKKFAVSPQEIRDANGISKNHVLIANSTIEIPEKSLAQPVESDTVSIPKKEIESTNLSSFSKGDTIYILLKGLLPNENERKGYLLYGDTLKIIKGSSSLRESKTEKILRVETLPEKIVEFALSLLGTKYSYGGTTKETGFDCSGFVKYVFSKFEIELPHSSKEQYKIGKAISMKELSIADILFFDLPGRPRLGHVGIYIGENQFVHAASGKERRVTISNLDSRHYQKRLVGARRISL